MLFALSQQFVRRSLAGCVLLGIITANAVGAQSDFLNPLRQLQFPADDQPTLVAQKLDPKSAQTAGQKESADSTVAAKQEPDQITAERRIELIRFVRANHPELEKLINSLRKQRPAEYQSALRYLDKSVTNLSKYKKVQSEERYKQVLEDWKLKSRITLLSAQLSISDTPARRNQLRQLLTRQLDNRYRQFKSDADRTQKRLDRLKEEIEKIESNRAELIQRQMDSVIKTAERINAIRARQEKQDKQASGAAQNSEPSNKPDSSGGKNKHETN